MDFLITESGSPQFMVDAKLSDINVSPHLIKFQRVLDIPAIQLVNKPNIARKIRNGSNSVLIVSAPDWLSWLIRTRFSERKFRRIQRCMSTKT